MAQLIDQVQIHVANTDLAVERQNILRETIKENFERLNETDPSKERSLIYVINHDGKFLPNVLIANKEADVVFTGFNVERKIKVRKKKELILDTDQSDVLQIDPTLRFPAYQEILKIMDRGEFRLRRLILVGDLNGKIRDLLRLGFKIKVTLFADEERSKVFPPILIESPDQLPLIGGEAVSDQIDIGKIDSITIGDISFDGVINMTEEGNQFFIKDDSIHDTIKKIFQLEGIKETVAQEAIEEEKKLFVRRKKVMVVLDPDLKKIVADKLKFDKMEKIYEYTSIQEALEALETGKTQGVVEYLEEEGYDVVHESLDVHDKDMLLIAILGKRLLPGYLEKEMKIQGSNLKLLPAEKIQEIFNLFPEPFVDRLLTRLQNKNYQSFLSRIPSQLREPIILDFLSIPEKAIKCWKTLADPDRTKILSEKSANILATLNLVNTSLFEEKFPDVKIPGEKYISSEFYAELTDEQKKKYLSSFSEALSSKKIAKEDWKTIFTTEQFNELIGQYIALYAASFYNDMTAVLKKQIWNAVGAASQKTILKNMHYLDKATIIEGSKEHMLQFVTKEINFLVQMIKRGEALELGGKLLIGLKQFNRLESKTGLFKKLIQNKKLQAHRVETLTAFLCSPEGRVIYDKLVEKIEALATGYDSLICISEDREELQKNEALQGATVTLVDELVDASLLKMFKEGEVNMDEYDEYAAEIEKKIEELKAQLAKSGMDDPVGGYLLETMVVMMNMASKAVKNELDSSMIDALDEREEIRNRVVEDMKKNVKATGERLEHNRDVMPRLIERKKDQEVKLEAYNEKVNNKLGSLQKYVKAFETVQENLKKSELNKRKVAIQQRNLSIEFFNLIKPMILSELRSLPPILEKVIYTIRDRFFPPESMRRRTIFKFTDDEIRKIFKKRITFVSNDEQLKGFIFTCLKIDRLDNQLFHIAGTDNIPTKPQLLFIGADLANYDFSNYISPEHIHPFSDEKFYQTLVKNEVHKKNTKEHLKKFKKDQRELKNYLEREGNVLKGFYQTKKVEQKKLDDLEDSRSNLEKSIASDEELLEFLNSEKETMDEKFNEIDIQFKVARESIMQALEGENSAVDSIEEETRKMSQQLSETLMNINQEMASLMFIKNVKEAAEKISKDTQSNIIKKMDKLSTFTAGKAGVKSVVIANDGSNESTNLKRVMNIACSEHFGIEEKDLINMSMGRLETNIAEAGQQHSIVFIIGDDRSTRLKNYRELVKKIKTKVPSTYIVLFSPYKVDESKKADDLVDNMNAIRDYCLLVNTDIIDYTNKNRLLKLLNEIAPMD